MMRPPSSSPHCHETNPPGTNLRVPPDLTRTHTNVGRRTRPTWRRTGPTPKVGPALVCSMCLSDNSTRHRPTASYAGVALPADRNTHRLKRGRIRRALRRASCAAASPTSASVTQFQSGGSPSSVEHVDVIGSSFPLRATAESSVTDLLQVSPSLAPKGTPFELHVRKGAGRGFPGNTMFIRLIFGHSG